MASLSAGLCHSLRHPTSSAAPAQSCTRQRPRTRHAIGRIHPALLAGVEAHGGKVWSVDIDERSAGVAAGHPLWTFVHGSSTNPDLIASKTGAEPFDLLLIDTEHTYNQAAAELALWGPHVAPGGTICMHDPETFPGVRRAATEFAGKMGWPITFVLPNNGMAVIERPRA
jgi:predicted O-methyltransferase YrrM